MKVKKSIIILIISLILTACGSNDEETITDNQNENNETSEKEVYEIGDTVTSEVANFGYEFSVTLNDLELVEDEYKGYTFDEFRYGSDEIDPDMRFVLANVTIKNMDETSFKPRDTIDALLTGEEGFLEKENEATIETDFFDKLEPGEEVTDEFIFITEEILKQDVAYLHFNHYDEDLEFKFELPISKDE